MKALSLRQKLDMTRLYDKVIKNRLENKENCNICYINLNRPTRNILAKYGYIRIVEASEENNTSIDIVEVLKFEGELI